MDPAKGPVNLIIRAMMTESNPSTGIPQDRNSEKRILEVLKLTKRFSSVVANDEINFAVNQGEIHGLLGENGAGKSTLAECLFGYYLPDSGEIKVRGQTFSFSNPADAKRAGIGMVHQHFSLVEPFTVIENVLLGAGSLGGMLNFSAVEVRFKELMDSYNVNIDVHARVSQLSVGELQWVEILKSLYYGIDLLILDEPTAVLTPQETDRLFRVLKEMTSRGLSIILITHKLQEVMDVTDRVTVLRKGKKVGTVNTTDVTIRELSRMMVGRDVESPCKEEGDRRGNPVLEIKELEVLNDSKRLALKAINLEIAENEILGLAGIAGNGQKELFEALVGVREVTAGEIQFEGRELSKCKPDERIRLGIGFIPDDRIRTGLIGDFSVAENLILGRQWDQEYHRGFFQRGNNIRTFAKESIEDYEIVAPSQEHKIRHLSGGNQQKVIIARETSTTLKLLLANQPTRGLDVGAIEYVTNKLLELREQGMAILLASEDLEELLNLSDRIAVIHEGKIMGILSCDKTNIIEIGMLMAGVKDGGS